VFENRVTKRIFGPKREEGPKQWKMDMTFSTWDVRSFCRVGAIE
jgi:hypothetical protein